MSCINLNLPHSIERHLQEMADLDGIPVEQFVATAIAEKISALTAENYLHKRRSRANPAAFQSILDKVPERVALPDDQ